VAVNGKGVATVDDIHRLLASQSAGARISLTVLRENQRRELQVVSGEV
jgi:S1-C subfamily serine protease